MNDKEFPILEYDNTKEPFLKPEDVIKPADISEHCVLCFFSEAITNVLDKFPNEIITKLRVEGCDAYVYEIDYNGKKIILMQALVGAPLAAAQLEELTTLGCKKYICCGSCGALEKDLSAGHIVIPTSAVRDEGTSYHYTEPAREATGNEKVIAVMEETLKEANIDYVTGKTWTTDALYRETVNKINKRKQEGCIVVDMEASAYMIVAAYKNVEFGQFLYAGDDLGGDAWDYRDYLDNLDVRGMLLRLSLDACLKL